MQAAIKTAGVQRNSSLKTNTLLLYHCPYVKQGAQATVPPSSSSSYNAVRRRSIVQVLDCAHTTQDKKAAWPVSSIFLGREEEIWGNSIACLCPGRLRLRQSTHSTKERGARRGRVFYHLFQPSQEERGKRRHFFFNSFFAFQDAALLMLPSVLKQELETVS